MITASRPVSEIELILVERYRTLHRRRLYLLLRDRLEQIAYAPGWEKKP